jgi:hypothetical protein
MPKAEGCFSLGTPHCSGITLHKTPAEFHILDPLSITKGGLEWKQYAGHFIFQNLLVFPYTEKNLLVLCLEENICLHLVFSIFLGEKRKGRLPKFTLE